MMIRTLQNYRQMRSWIDLTDVTDGVHWFAAVVHSQGSQGADGQHTSGVQYWIQPMKILANRIILEKHQSLISLRNGMSV